LGRQSGKQTTFAHVCFTSRIERLHSTSSSSAKPAALVVEVGAAKVSVRPGFDAALLRAVIVTLHEVLR
jgi:hypothetical protein